MASFVGHSLGALTAYQVIDSLYPNSNKPSLYSKYGLVLFLAILPDLDVLSYIAFGWSFGGIHRGYSHSFSFGISVAVILALPFFYYGWKIFLRLFCALTCASAIHPLLDYFMACGPKLPLFWPFIKIKYLADIQLIPTAYYSHSLSGLFKLLWAPQSLKGMSLEMLQFLPLWLFFLLKSRALKLLCLGLSLLGFMLVLLLY
ncbi:metal-dependent hydrolase [bacterium]|nr:metal-dependent hydrolase [bacterium]